MEDKKDIIIELYEYYFNMIDLMVSDMSNVKLSDIQDVVEELHIELNKIGDIEKDESNAD